MQNDRHPFIMLFYQIKLTERIAQPRTLLFAQIRDFLSSHFPHNRLMKSIGTALPPTLSEKFNFSKTVFVSL